MSTLYSVCKRREISAPDSGRPRLLPLAPIGLGTGDVEALSSYLVRLANAHWVSPTRLYLELIEKHAGLRVRPLKSTAGLDGYGSSAHWLTDAISEFSPLRSSFRELSCLRWKGVVSKRQHGVMAETMRWCVLCYREMRQREVPLHNKLLWSVKSVDACHDHGNRLSTVCSSCGRRPCLNRSNSIAGLCSYCGSNLADQAPEIPVSGKIRDSIMWKARAVHEFLRFTHDHELRRADFERSLESVIADFGEGSATHVTRQLNLPEWTLQQWRRKGYRPNLTTFLEFCYRLDIPPARFFDKTVQLISGPRTLHPKVKAYGARRMSQERFELIKSQLAELIESGEELGTACDVATRMGITSGVFAKRFPVEQQIVVRRFRERRAEEKDERDRARCRRVEAWARELLSNGVYPSHRQVKRGSGIVPSDLRNPIGHRGPTADSGELHRARNTPAWDSCTIV